MYKYINVKITQPIVSKLNFFNKISILRKNWVVATNSDYLIPISLHPDIADLLNV